MASGGKKRVVFLLPCLPLFFHGQSQLHSLQTPPCWAALGVRVCPACTVLAGPLLRPFLTLLPPPGVAPPHPTLIFIPPSPWHEAKDSPVWKRSDCLHLQTKTGSLNAEHTTPSVRSQDSGGGRQFPLRERPAP